MAEDIEEPEDSWFERHLNWTFMLGVFLPYQIVLGVSLVFLAFYPILFFIIAVVTLCIAIITEIWYLKQKGRTLWYLFANLLWGWGLLWMLLLSNRNKGEIDQILHFP